MLAARFRLLRAVGIGLARGRNVFDRLAKHQQRLSHAGDLVVTADRNRHVGFARRDPAHRAAQQRQPADDAAPDIEPADQAGRRQRRDAQHDQNDPAES